MQPACVVVQQLRTAGHSESRSVIKWYCMGTGGPEGLWVTGECLCFFFNDTEPLSIPGKYNVIEAQRILCYI